eukprot:6183789-Pleurochrysis_carterae.AAC.2
MARAQAATRFPPSRLPEAGKETRGGRTQHKSTAERGFRNLLDALRRVQRATAAPLSSTGRVCSLFDLAAAQHSERGGVHGGVGVVVSGEGQGRAVIRWIQKRAVPTSSANQTPSTPATCAQPPAIASVDSQSGR